MSERLESMCDLLEDELDRQEDMLAICKAQGRAALEHDLELIEARTEALNALIALAAESESRRIALARELVDAYQLPPARQSLSGLIEAVPQPWKQRMRDFQQRMRAVLEETRETVRANNRLFRRSAKVVAEALDVLTQTEPAARGQYDARGGDSGVPGHVPAFIDQRG